MAIHKKKRSGRNPLGIFLVLAVLALSVFGSSTAASADEQLTGEETSTVTDTPAPKDDSSFEAPAAPEPEVVQKQEPVKAETPDPEPKEEPVAPPKDEEKAAKSDPKPATVNDGQVCGPLDSGKIDTTGDPQSVTVTAPEGMLISGYCVKAGSVNSGNGPVYVELDSPVDSLVITYPGGKAVSHYSLSYVPEDVCPELEGDQPEGTDCDPVVIDVCENLPGNQPEGTDCTEDVCPELEGDQPEGTDCDPATEEPEASATWTCDSVTVHNDYTDAANVTITMLDQDGKVVPGSSKDYSLAAGEDLTRSDLTKGTWDVLVTWDSSEDAVFEEMHEVTGCDTPPGEPQDTGHSTYCGGFTLINPEGNPELKFTYSDASQGGTNSTSIILAGGEESDPIDVDYTSAHVIVEGTDTEYFDEYNITIPQDCGEGPGEGDVSVKPGCGFVTVTNNEDESMQFMYGSFENVEPDGTVNVETGKTVKVKTKRSSLDYFAYFDKSGKSNQGTVKVKQHCDSPSHSIGTPTSLDRLLPDTGGSNLGLLAIGGALALAGSVITVASRRRTSNV